MIKSVRSLLNKKGLSLVSVMVAVGIMGVVATAFMTIIQNMTNNQNRTKFLDSVTALNDEIRTHLSYRTACQQTLNGLTAAVSTTVAVTNIKNSDATVKYAQATTFDQTLKITTLSLVMSSTAGTPTTGTLWIVYTANNKVAGPSTATRQIDLDIVRNGSNVITNCISKAVLTDGVWKRVSTTVNDIYYTTGDVGVGTASPTAPLQIFGSGSGASIATTGTSDPTANIRVCRGVVCMDQGTVDSGLSYLKNRNVSDMATAYSLALNPNGGNVGIGTISPTQKLELGSGHISLGYFSGTANLYHYIGLSGAAGAFTDGSGAGGMYIKTEADALSNSVGFFTHNSGVDSQTRMFINKSGYVGIGTTVPIAPLHVAGGIVPIQFGDSGTAAANFYWLLNSAFLSLNNGNYGSGTAVMTIASGGNIGLGSTNPTNRLEVIDAANTAVAGVYNPANNAGYGYCGVAGVFWGCLGRYDGYAFVGIGQAWNSTGTWTGSDERLKENINPLSYGLSTVDQLRPVTFRWKPDSVEYLSVKDRLQMGLIAQEVKTLLPHSTLSFPWVEPGKKTKPSLNSKLGTILSVDYTSLISVLIKSLQELFHKLSALTDTTSIQDGQLTALEQLAKAEMCPVEAVDSNRRELEQLKQKNERIYKNLQDLKKDFCAQNKDSAICQAGKVAAFDRGHK